MSLGSVWLCLLFGWVALEAVLALATRTRRGEGTVHDRGSQLIVWLVIVFSFIAGGWVAYPAAEMHMSRHALRMAGIVLICAGLAVRIVAIASLGKWFSANVAIRSAQTLYRRGLYRLVRHPSYLGMEIIFLAVGVHAHNWASLAALCILPTLAVLYRIHVEETALLSAFGEEYASYMRTTRRLIPWLY